MRKYILLLIVFVFVFGASVKAAPNTPEGVQLQQDLYDWYGKSYSDNAINQIINWWSQLNSDVYMVVHPNPYQSTSLEFVGAQNYSTTQNYRVWEFYSPVYVAACRWDTMDFSSTIVNQTYNINDSVPVNVLGKFADYGDNTDYSTVYYDPFIPTPIINSYYFTDTGVGADYFPCVCNVQDFQGNITYLQVIVRYYTPEYITVYNNGSFKVTSLNHSNNRELVGLRDKVTDSLINLTNLIETDWNSYVTGNNPPELVGQDSNFENSNAFAYLSNQYNNVRNIQTLYGNAFEIWARYYEIRDNKIYVGSWFDWYSRNTNNFNIALPSWFVINDPVVGVQNTVNNTGTDFVGLNPIGTDTGQDINIEVNGTMVPNYPDYPTVVTYNHDNIFIQFIETAKQLPQFFGDTVSLFSGMFAFIPEWIWGIIGFGFICNIVVMIVKVL